MTQNKLLALTAVVLGLLALVAGTPRRYRPERADLLRFARQIENEEDHVSPDQLAAAIMNKDNSFRLYDLRDSVSFAAYHIPSAIRVELDTLLQSSIDPADSIILYSEGGTHASQAWVLLRVAGYKKIRTLKNGLQAWEDEIRHPVTHMPPDFARLIAARASYFGGAIVSPVDTSKKAVTKPAVTTAHRAAKPAPPPNNMRVEERTREGC